MHLTAHSILPVIGKPYRNFLQNHPCFNLSRAKTFGQAAAISAASLWRLPGNASDKLKQIDADIDSEGRFNNTRARAERQPITHASHDPGIAKFILTLDA